MDTRPKVKKTIFMPSRISQQSRRCFLSCVTVFIFKPFKSPIAGIFNWNLCLRNTEPKHYQLIEYSRVCKNIGPHGIDMQTSQQGTTINYNLRGSRKGRCLEETLPFFIPTLLKC